MSRLVARAAGMRGLDPALTRRLTQSYSQLRPWPEVPRVLAAIAATMPIGTVTNCPGELGHLAAGLAGVPFGVTVTAQGAGACKPRPEPYQRALGALALPAGRVLFVAGSPYDIPGAGRLGMDVVAQPDRHARPSGARAGRRASLTRSAPGLRQPRG